MKDMWTSEEETTKHRHCAWHVQSNFTTVFKGQQLKLKMMAIAMSTTMARFKIEMDEIKKED